MTNLEKYNKAFMEALELSEDQLTDALEYQGVSTWDSVGHMELIAELEDCFEIMFETDDIVDFSSYKIGKELLSKYDIVIE